MKSMRGTGMWMSAAALALFTLACNNTEQGLKRDAEENRREAAESAANAKAKAESSADRAQNAAEKAGDAAADASRAAADAAEHAGRAIGNAVGTAGQNADAASQTTDVKAALVADKRIDASHIDVDTIATPKMVILKGRVPTEAQKKLAEDIAAGKATGYRIDNQLTVGR
jgi:osmotically-inducible protein OsmY